MNCGHAINYHGTSAWPTFVPTFSIHRPLRRTRRPYPDRTLVALIPSELCPANCLRTHLILVTRSDTLQEQRRCRRRRLASSLNEERGQNREKLLRIIILPIDVEPMAPILDAHEGVGWGRRLARHLYLEI